MASYPQRKLMTDILNISGFIVQEYRFIDEVGIVLFLANQQNAILFSSKTLTGLKDYFLSPTG
jgi:hypothetical protein